MGMCFTESNSSKTQSLFENASGKRIKIFKLADSNHIKHKFKYFTYEILIILQCFRKRPGN